MTNINYRPLSG